jgi:hypothetical protein
VIVVGILGLVAVIAVCTWVVFRDPEAMSGRAVQERARSLEQLARELRREESRPGPALPRDTSDDDLAADA